ncbi:hypothetical protein Syun_017701 [Stephania yunnanensis]|uniref:Uncharacterized protein n=1 Tax=Stephania yunnanensis TaxID=152371 RepID=A0AAP0P3L6_9MAGN
MEKIRFLCEEKKKIRLSARLTSKRRGRQEKTENQAHVNGSSWKDSLRIFQARDGTWDTTFVRLKLFFQPT